MAHLSKRPLVGIMSDSSMFFLEDNGFVNIESIAHLSVWSNMVITLFLPLDTIVMDYKSLFNLIYDSGLKKGEYNTTKKIKWGIKSKLEDFIFVELKL